VTGQVGTGFFFFFHSPPDKSNSNRALVGASPEGTLAAMPADLQEPVRYSCHEPVGKAPAEGGVGRLLSSGPAAGIPSW